MNKTNSSFMIVSSKYDFGYARNDFHAHNDYELIYVTDGELTIKIGEKIYCAKKNNLILITNLEKHMVLNVTNDYCRYVVNLRPNVTDKYIRNPILVNTLKNHNPEFMHCIDLTEQESKARTIFDNIINCSSTDIFANELVTSYIIQLLVIAFKQSSSLLDNSELPCKEIILNIQKYLDKHFTEDIKIADICKEFCINSCYLSHKFKELTGFSPKQYLTYIRIRQSASILYYSIRPISDVAYACGFRDVNNFIKVFKREFNCLPSNYRKESYGK